MEKITKKTYIVFILMVVTFGIVLASISSTGLAHAQANNMSSYATKNITSAAKSMTGAAENKTTMTIQNISESSKLRVIVIFEVKEGKKQEALNIINSLADLAKKREGNISYDIYSSTENPNELLLDQLWSSKAAFDKHYNSPEASKDRQALRNLSLKLLENETFEGISKIQP